MKSEEKIKKEILKWKKWLSKEEHKDVPGYLVYDGYVRALEWVLRGRGNKEK